MGRIYRIILIVLLFTCSLASKQVEYNLIKGNLSEALPALDSLFYEYHNTYKSIKIGITGRNPQRRFYEHKKKDSTWQKMIVVYYTDSFSRIKELERLMVEKTWEFNVNHIPGGTGITMTKDGNYFLYFLLK